jgi:hypothetical protein
MISGSAVLMDYPIVLFTKVSLLLLLLPFFI